MKVVAFTKYNYAGASSRYRYYNYINCFHTHNIKLTISPFFTDKYLQVSGIASKIALVLVAYVTRFWLLIKTLITKRKYDLVIVEYELFPYFPSLFEKLLKLRKIPYIVDYDDAIFHKYDKHKNGLIRWLLKNKIAKVMQNAETVIVGNTYLEGYAKKYNHNTLLLPTVVLLEKYRDSMNNFTIDKKDETFVIGWIGSKTTSSYVLDILPAIERFVATHDAECHFIGLDKNLLTTEMKEKCKITVISWSEDTEVNEMLKFDVGIMPLKDDAWSKGKCGFKLIQYMSCKKPVIASPVGVNNSIVTEGVNGYLASTNEEWYSAFEKLYNDKELRKSMAENNWQKIKTEFSHKLNCEKYVGLIKSIMGND